MTNEELVVERRAILREGVIGAICSTLMALMIFDGTRRPWIAWFGAAVAIFSWARVEYRRRVLAKLASVR